VPQPTAWLHPSLRAGCCRTPAPSASKSGAGTLVFVVVIALSAIVWFIGKRTSAT
jgi:hypothetical protein